VHGAPSSDTCRELEERDQDRILHPLRKAAITRSTTVLKNIRKVTTVDEQIKVIQSSRSAVAGYIKTAFGLHLRQSEMVVVKNDWWVIMSILDDIYREVRSK